MQAIVETLFDAAYLITVITIGILMIRRSKGNVQYTLFGWMAVVLGAGDSFHLIPRALALCTTGLESYTFALGLGKWITSVTMTVFYVLLYYVWRERYEVEGHKSLTVAVYALAAIRVILCILKMSWPQNSMEPSVRTPSTKSHMRLNVRSSVDLPQPDGPMKAQQRFSGIWRSIDLSAWKSVYQRSKSRMSMAASASSMLLCSAWVNSFSLVPSISQTYR